MAAGASETPLVCGSEDSFRTHGVELNRKTIAPRQTRMTGTTTTRRGLSSGDEFWGNSLMGWRTPRPFASCAPAEKTVFNSDQGDLNARKNRRENCVTPTSRKVKMSTEALVDNTRLQFARFVEASTP